MEARQVRNLLTTLDCEDVYQFLGQERDAQLEALQAAAEEKYTSIHNQSARDDRREAGLKLAGLCISDIFRSDWSKGQYDAALLSGSGGGIRGRLHRIPALVGSVSVRHQVSVVVALGLLALMGFAVFLLKDSDAGPVAGSSPHVATNEPEGRAGDIDAPGREAVQASTAGDATRSATDGRQGAPPKRTGSGEAASALKPKRRGTGVEQGAGTLTVRAPPASLIEVDGKGVGSTGANGILVLSGVQPGRHFVVARKDGHTEATSVVEVLGERAAFLELELPALPGRLTVTANVEDALLQIDNEGEHRLPLSDLELPAGTYRITASRQGFRAVANDVEIRPGNLTTLDIVLELVPVDELLKDATEQFAAGNYQAAAERADSVVRIRPDAGAAHRLLGSALLGLRRFDESISALSRAIDLGEKVELNTKHRHGGGGIRAGFCGGTIALSKDAITFRSEDQSPHGFSVTPDRMTSVEVTESVRGRAIRVDTMVLAEDRGGRKRSVDFVHWDTQRTRERDDSLFMVLTCRSCDASLNVQAALMKYVSQRGR